MGIFIDADNIVLRNTASHFITKWIDGEAAYIDGQTTENIN